MILTSELVPFPGRREIIRWAQSWQLIEDHLHFVSGKHRNLDIPFIEKAALQSVVMKYLSHRI